MIFFQAELGRQLALMHKAGTSAKGFGFDVDNTIGRSIFLSIVVKINFFIRIILVI